MLGAVLSRLFPPVVIEELLPMVWMDGQNGLSRLLLSSIHQSIAKAARAFLPHTIAHSSDFRGFVQYGFLSEVLV